MTTPDSGRAAALLDVTHARVSPDRDGSCVVDDPDCPWIVRLWLGTDGQRRQISRLQIDVRPGVTAPIIAARMARLPIAQILQVAIAATAAGPDIHPNEMWYRMLARPKPPGVQQWDDEHWDRVLAVYDWATTTGRPGGGARAVADLWNVRVNPTVYRWLGAARRRRQIGAP